MRTPRASAALLALAVAASAAAPTAAEDKAAEILSAARKAIGGKKLDTLKTFSLDATLQRNMNNIQLSADVEISLDLPDKYVRSDASSGMMNMTIATGFIGEKPIRPANAVSMGAGGGMMIRMGGAGPQPPTEKS